MSLLHEESGDHCRKDNDNSDNWQHLGFPGFGYMVAARIFAGLHCLACAVQQRLQRVSFHYMAGADTDGEAYTIAPPAKVRGPREAGKTPRVFEQKFGVRRAPTPGIRCCPNGR